MFWYQCWKRTSLENVDLLHGIPLRAVALLQLGDLHLLAELFEVSLPAGVCRGPLAGGLVDELLLDLAHVFVALDHFRKVIRGTGEGHAFLLEEAAGAVHGVERLLVKGEFAVEIVLDVFDFNGGFADNDLVFGKGQFGREGNGLVGFCQGGRVVDGQALVGDDVLLVFGCH